MADRTAPHKSLISLLALVCAIISFFVHSGILGLVLAIIAIVLGLIGFLLALSPGLKGGGLSLVAVLLGAAGAICGIIRAIWHFAHHL